jgi:hypothetical protein
MKKINNFFSAYGREKPYSINHKKIYKISAEVG